MIIEKSLSSDRLQLRNLQRKDITEHYVSWMQDQVISQFLEARFSAHSRPTLEIFVDKQNTSTDALLLGIFLKESKQHIGNIKLGNIRLEHKRGDIGIIIGAKEHWGKGYAAEAISTLTDYAFSKLSLHKVTASCYESNKGSIGAFQKAGYIIEGTLKSHWYCKDHWEDSCLMANFAKND